MTFDLDALIDQAFPWDFSVRVGGALHAVRPLVAADLIALQAAFGSGSRERIETALGRLFAAPPPDLRAVRDEGLVALMHATLDHWREQAAKNSPAIAPAVTAAMAAARGAAAAAEPAGAARSTTPGSSS